MGGLFSAAATPSTADETKRQPVSEDEASRLLAAVKMDRSSKSNSAEAVRRLGEGSFGQVFGVRGVNGKSFAVKRMRKDEVSPVDVKREVEILEHLNPVCKDYIVCYRSRAEDDTYVYLVTELLEDFLTANEYFLEYLSSDHKMIQVVQNMILAVKTVHDAQVAHRDLKPSNFMIEVKSGQVKIIDFGLACLKKECQQSRNFTGTPEFMAPELWGGVNLDRLQQSRGDKTTLTKPYSLDGAAFTLDSLQRADLWALGLTIFQCVARREIFDEWIYSRLVKLPPQERNATFQQRPRMFWVAEFATTFDFNNPLDPLAPLVTTLEATLSTLSSKTLSLRSLLNTDPQKRSLPLPAPPHEPKQAGSTTQPTFTTPKKRFAVHLKSYNR